MWISTMICTANKNSFEIYVLQVSKQNVIAISGEIGLLELI